jgi:hypothetical protein
MPHSAVTAHPWDVSGIRTAIGPVLRAIALDAMSRGVGHSLPTSADYQSRFGVGAGTVQRALTMLQDQGALSVRARGHLGRTVSSLDVGRAWQSAGLPPVRLVVPPAGTAEIDALTDHLGAQLALHHIPHTERHERGADRRIAAVVEGVDDVAVVSRGAAAESPLLTAGTTVRTLAPGTYYARDRLVVVRRVAATSQRPRRIGIDRDSRDHSMLTNAEFPPDKGYQHVACAFTDIPAAVLRGEVDAGVWHRSYSVIPLDLAGLDAKPIRRGETLAVWERLSAAVLCASPHRPELRAAFAVLEFSALDDAQRAAIAVG